MAEPATSTQRQGGDAANLDRVKSLLRARDDTQRFVGLAILKSVLDNSPELRQNHVAVQDLWACISPKFLDRLLRTGSASSAKGKDAGEMLNLAVSVLHTFGLLLPPDSLENAKFPGRVPLLISALLQSSPETTLLILQLLNTLASTRAGAESFIKVDDISPLTEIAPSNPLALDVLRYAWLHAMGGSLPKRTLSESISKTLKILVPSFTGTDAVTLLDFLGDLLRQADKEIIPAPSLWLKPTVNHVRNLVISRPTPEARAAYTNFSASLLQVYPKEAADALFTGDHKSEKPFGFLLINLLLIDIRSSTPMILEQLNSPEYAGTARRLASAYDVIAMFIGFLVRCLDDDRPMPMPPDSLLKLRSSISETMSVTTEYLRDRWDSSVAGAMGLHTEARTSTTETATGSYHSLAWDSMKNRVDQDPLTLSSLRCLSLWLREDENDDLRQEATGLIDMLTELYQSGASQGIDFRSPVLVALEALVTLDQGREILLSHDGWKTLSRDLVETVRDPTRLGQQVEITRGTDTVRVLLPIVEQQRAGTAEEWMDLITAVAAWDLDENRTLQVEGRRFVIAVLQLCSSILVGASQGMRRRYTHSVSAVSGIAHRLAATLDEGGPADIVTQYNALFLGSDQGVNNTLAKAFAAAGKTTAMVERTALNLTCINTGCTPTKTMISSGRAAHMVQRGGENGNEETATSSLEMQLDGGETVKGTHLLLAIGHVPNTDMLSLEAAGVRATARGHIIVDDKLQTSAEGVCAPGDVLGGPAFTHMSYDDSRIIHANLLDITKPSTTRTRMTAQSSRSRNLTPDVAFTDPQLAHVGLHGRDLLADGGRGFRTAVMPMSCVTRAAETAEGRGMMKVSMDDQTGEILGFTCLSIEGGEIMSLVQTAMMGGLRWWDLEGNVYAHPTMAESLNKL
ncbi:Pyruvate/2-oxoglutarate dehydrogenase complex, dihydrolipoamide dehydrogenase (E3) component [Geosmithia morbida]|uniref:Pyruvate/2-oxoglutarate dehydrogenase complex, dihydrolipoamide dehydrogenase (E3) component n=1 Tax=Geosmithia morbida TaxID=1094350 RepID=A0A9P4YVE0_9HYPO|nr:Pyruvate/2-oxoglutarate dehydrogenase complex, dihydrolipoamide dehydrogenase (E3) component [Geosmithia morbida]KAF4123237.1 Pyruvate/2-oxoglutarate dehydrogenase complex, dihydrolipoamide dehydrogenase (E3) component [Geosmithia morbida]